VIARARMLDEVDPLLKAGAHEVVPEELAGSVEMFARVLTTLQVPDPVVESCIDHVHKDWAGTYPPTILGFVKSNKKEGEEK